jgi:ATP-dependent exoDNAse (exonuclease V) alpha subunit
MNKELSTTNNQTSNNSIITHNKDEHQHVENIQQEEIYSLIINNITNLFSNNKNIPYNKIFNINPFDNIISLNGAAGTGKTYLTTRMVKDLSKKHKVVFTAPTHKALNVVRKNLRQHKLHKVQTQTIHSFLNIKLQTDFRTGIQKFIPDKSKMDKSVADVLIVDESSMVSKELFEYILDCLRSSRVKIVFFVGDSFQLLPVDSNENCISKINIQYTLTDIVRQAKDSYIIEIATKVRNIIENQEYSTVEEFFKQNYTDKIEFFHTKEEFYEDFCKNKNWTQENKVITSFKNSDVDYHNEIIRKAFWNTKEITQPDSYLKGDIIVFQDANVKNGTILHNNGDEVVIHSATKKHNKELDIYYWECLDIIKQPFNIIDKESEAKYNNFLNTLVKRAKQEEHPYKRKLIWEDFYAFKEHFSEVKYSFASTIHKLQGSTYETIYIDLLSLSYLNKLDKDLLFRLLYVAITRASKDIKILIPKFLEEKNIDNLFNKYLN